MRWTTKEYALHLLIAEKLKIILVMMVLIISAE